MRRREDRGKTSGTISRRVLVALLSLLIWVALPSAGYAFRYRPPYIRIAGSEPPRHFRQERPPYPGGYGQRSRPPYQGGRFQHAPSPYQGGPRNGVGRAPYRGYQGWGSQGAQEDELHLPGWIERHGNMPLADQERALEGEPGFKQLSPESQQRVLQSLRHIESLPPDRRARTLGYIEAMERLSPERRQQVSASVYAIRTIPPDRRRVVTMALRDLIQYPPQERQAIMSQRQFQSRFSPEELNILGNILAVEPYQPPPIGPPPGPPFPPPGFPPPK